MLCRGMHLHAGSWSVPSRIISFGPVSSFSGLRTASWSLLSNTPLLISCFQPMTEAAAVLLLNPRLSGPAVLKPCRSFCPGSSLTEPIQCWSPPYSQLCNRTVTEVITELGWWWHQVQISPTAGQAEANHNLFLVMLVLPLRIPQIYVGGMAQVAEHFLASARL
jgi:hypothetical protein